MNKRNSGILLHITSLPGDEGIGTLGENARRFIDFLNETGQKIWQILPLGPAGAGNSPYQCYSAFAGSPLIIDLKLLVDEKLIAESELETAPVFIKKRVDFKKVEKWKLPVLKNAFNNFRNNRFEKLKDEYHSFLREHSWWLNDFAIFMAAKTYYGNKHWSDWDAGLKFRENEALQKTGIKLAGEIDFHKFIQFLFFRQWFQLKSYANSKGIEIIGDVPLYVSGDSSDVWTNTDIFLLDKNLDPVEVGGVPPDVFSETGQLWGNPVFNWPRLKERDYDWWMARLHFNLNMFNRVRIDHFRGLESYWSVPAGEETAINGRWMPAYGFEMLAKIKSQIGELPFIAEDLGIITPEVKKLRDDFNLPGMKILQFAFTTDATNEYLPHNYSENFVVYTGTHDNDTTLGWLKSVAGDEQKMVKKYLNELDVNGLRNSIEMAFSSVAKTAIIPMQDILELNSDARLNTPGTAVGNWGWRFRWGQLKLQHQQILSDLTEKYNR